MTATQTRPDTAGETPVAHDLYRDIHKAIRSELFGLTLDTGSLDPGDTDGRFEIATRVDGVVGLLIGHAGHEDTAIQPVLAAQLPDLAAIVELEHTMLESEMDVLRELAHGAVDAGDPRWAMHRLYRRLAAFTADYLKHQDAEESLIMPALEQAVGVDAVVGIHQAIVGSIPPAEMMGLLPIMLRSMNVEDRVEMLGGMRVSAPPEAFAGVWNLAGSALDARDFAAVGARLGIA